MSDKKLRDLERLYATTGNDRDLAALLGELARLEPLPCPNCGRSIYDESATLKACSWCGTRWSQTPAKDHLRRVEHRIRVSEQPPLQFNLAGTQTGRLSSSGGPNLSNRPRSQSAQFVGEGITTVRRDPSTPLIAGEGIQFMDSPEGVVVSLQDPTELEPVPNPPTPCSIVTCSEPAWRSPLEAILGADMCLGHSIEYSDREGIEVPQILRQELKYQIRDRDENG